MNRSASFLSILSLCFVLILLMSKPGWGQDCYHFPNIPFTNSSGYTDSSGHTILLNDQTWCAANGYGVWTTEGTNWFLMGNEVHEEATSPNSAISPSGVIAEGRLGSDANGEVKVATNLQGQVRYVWVSRSTRSTHDGGNSPRDQFTVWGFNPTDVNVNFTQFPYATNSRKVISTPIHPYTFVPTYTLPDSPANNVGAAIDEANPGDVWPDEFSICMDAKYLYIVWEKDYIFNTTPYNEIWATAQLLDPPYTIAFGPTRIDGGLNSGRDYNHVGGRRPTIDCDKRNHDVNNHPTLGPCFDVAYIDSIPAAGSSPTLYPGGNVMQVFVQNGVIVSRAPMPKFVVKISEPTTAPYFQPMRARMVVASSLRIPSPAPQKGIYVLVYPGGDFSQSSASLLFHPILSQYVPQPPLNPYAFYVDGSDDPGKINDSTHEGPLKFLVPTGTRSVINSPIQAFANPYDGAPDSSYDEFHCLYQLVGGYNVIVRGIHNGLWKPLQQAILNRQCTNCGTTPPPDPCSRTWSLNGTQPTFPIGCANQMGIHTYWTQGGVLNYSRDIRAFDENIEENTLATDSCIVSSTVIHGGTNAVPLNPGKTLAFWTDPNFGLSTGVSGVCIADYSQPASWRNARITIVGENVSLEIAGAIGAGNLARLVVLPNFEFKFTASSQALNIRPYGVFDYYGYPNGTWTSGGTGPAVTSFLGTGTVALIGGSVTGGSGHDAPTALSSPAELTVHGGANFKLPETVAFFSSNSRIDFPYEHSIIPAWTTSPNATATGVANLSGTVTITRSWVFANIPSGLTGSAADILLLNKCIPTGGTSVTNQLAWTNSKFENDGSGGFATMNILGPSIQTVLGGKFDATGIRATDPNKSIYISYPLFANTKTRAIDLKLSSSAVTFDHVNVIGCRFTTFAANADAGIFADGFSVSADYEKLWFEGNNFTTNTGLSGSSAVGAAIHLTNSSGTVLWNTVSGTGYKNGVLNTGAATETNTFLCSNTISFCSDGSGQGTALSTTNWIGYSKLNEFSYNDIGEQSNDNDKGGIDFCHYHTNSGPGLKLVNATSKIDMSGVRHVLPNTDPDYAGWNTLNTNATSGGSTGEIEIANHSAELIIGTSDTATTNWGHNTFVADGTTNNNILYNSGGGSSYQVKTNINYFGTGSLLSPIQAIWVPGIDTIVNFHNAHSYLACCGGLFRNSSTPFVIDFSVDCGAGFDLAHKGGNPKIQSITEDSQAECERLQSKVDMLDQSHLYKEENDSGRFYIEHCAQQEGSFHAFVNLDGAVQFMSDDNDRWLDYRDWLKKVLYLSLDSLYYCADANSILNTFQYIRPGQGRDYEGLISVINYLLQNNRCPDAKKYLINTLQYYRDKQVQDWKDTVKDSTKTPLDTSDVTLESLDLQILRGPQSAVTSPSGISSLDDVFVTENPFTRETSLETTLHEAKMLKLEIYDLLGKKLYDENKFFSEGKVKWTLKGNSLPHETVYARISTIDGKVRSVKLIHE